MEIPAATPWPPWATTTFAGLLLCLAAIHLVDKVAGAVLGRSASVKSSQQARAATDNVKGGEGRGDPEASDTEFLRFRRQYLAVHGLAMFADWLQGTHMYSLYQVRPLASRIARRIAAELTRRSRSTSLFSAELRTERRRALLDRIPVVRCLWWLRRTHR